MTAKGGNKAQWKRYKQVSKTTGESSKGQHKHFSTKHSNSRITVKELWIELVDLPRRRKSPSLSVKIKLDWRVLPEKETFNSFLSRMIAVYGIPFSIVMYQFSDCWNIWTKCNDTIWQTSRQRTPNIELTYIWTYVMCFIKINHNLRIHFKIFYQEDGEESKEWTWYKIKTQRRRII